MIFFLPRPLWNIRNFVVFCNPLKRRLGPCCPLNGWQDAILVIFFKWDNLLGHSGFYAILERKNRKQKYYFKGPILYGMIGPSTCSNCCTKAHITPWPWSLTFSTFAREKMDTVRSKMEDVAKSVTRVLFYLVTSRMLLVLLWRETPHLFYAWHIRRRKHFGTTPAERILQARTLWEHAPLRKWSANTSPESERFRRF
jgi:hypothetical protein